jgi:hypothetical protein
VFVLSAAVAACSEGVNNNWPAEEQERSEHFRYYVRSDDSSLCPGITQDLERHRALVFGFLAGGLPEGDPIEYYKFRNTDDLRAEGPCRQSDGVVTQCQRDRRVWSSELFHQHELIHAYTAPRGRTARFLDEGLAESLTCGLDARSPAGIQLDELISWPDDEKFVERQDAASLFVARLLAVGGPGAYLDLSAQLEPGASQERVRTAIEAIYGSNPDELYAASQLSEPGAGCVRLWECSGEDWDPSSGGISYASPCGLPSFTPFTVSEPSLYIGPAAALLPCTLDVHSPAVPNLDFPRLQIAALEPGRYFVGTPGDPLRSPVPVELPAQVMPVGEVAGSSEKCTTLRNIDGPIDGAELSFIPRTLLQGRSGPAVLHLNDRFLPERARVAQGQGQQLFIGADCSDGLEVAVCEGCDASSCRVVCDGAGSSLEAVPIPQDLVLRLTPDATQLDTALRVSPYTLTQAE